MANNINRNLPFAAGDTVRCVRGSDNGRLVAGQTYTVALCAQDVGLGDDAVILATDGEECYFEGEPHRLRYARPVVFLQPQAGRMATGWDADRFTLVNRPNQVNAALAGVAPAAPAPQAAPAPAAPAPAAQPAPAQPQLSEARIREIAMEAVRNGLGGLKSALIQALADTMGGSEIGALVRSARLSHAAFNALAGRITAALRQ